MNNSLYLGGPTNMSPKSAKRSTNVMGIAASVNQTSQNLTQAISDTVAAAAATLDTANSAAAAVASTIQPSVPAQAPVEPTAAAPIESATVPLTQINRPKKLVAMSPHLLQRLIMQGLIIVGVISLLWMLANTAVKVYGDYHETRAKNAQRITSLESDVHTIKEFMKYDVRDLKKTLTEHIISELNSKVLQGVATPDDKATLEVMKLRYVSFLRDLESENLRDQKLLKQQQQDKSKTPMHSLLLP